MKALVWLQPIYSLRMCAGAEVKEIIALDEDDFIELPSLGAGFTRENQLIWLAAGNSASILGTADCVYDKCVTYGPVEQYGMLSKDWLSKVKICAMWRKAGESIA